MTIVGDLIAALAGAPRLPGAACVGRAALFDPPEPGEAPDAAQQRINTALALCNNCPALARCAEWRGGLPPRDRPVGVVAGRLNIPKKGTAA